MPGLKNRWFAPNSLKKTYQEGRLTGLYIPFWTYDAKADGWFTGRGRAHQNLPRQGWPHPYHYRLVPGQRLRGTIFQ